MHELIATVVRGDNRAAREHAERLMAQGVPTQSIIVDGLAVAMEQLDSKCSVADFDLLQIMLSGRCVLQVMDLLYQSNPAPPSWSKGVAVLGTIKGDVYDLGKNITKAVFTGAGYQVIDLGMGVPPQKFIDSAVETQADFILVSSLLTSTLRHIRPIRDAVPAGSRIAVVAGGSAVEQTCAEDINVDYAAANVFDGLRFCESRTEAGR